MPLQSGFHAIYQDTIRAKTRDLLVTIAQRDTLGTPDLQVVKMGRRLTWKWGSLIGGKIEKGLMPGAADLWILDPEQLIAQHFWQARTNGAVDTDFQVNISHEDSALDLDAYVRLKNVDAVEAHWVEVPVTKVQIYDGVGKLDEIQKSATLIWIESIFGESLDQTLFNKTIRYRVGFGATNAPSGEGLLDAQHYTARNRLADTEQFQDIMQMAVDLLTCRVWQGFDGLWHVEQPQLMGQAGTVQEDTGSPLVDVVVQETSQQLSRRHYQQGLRRSLRDPIAGINFQREIRNFSVETSVLGSPLVLDYVHSLFRGGRMRTLDTLVASGSGGGGSLDSRGNASDDCLLLADDQAMYQDMPWVEQDEPFYVQLRTFFAVEQNGSSGNQSAHARLSWIPWDSADDTYYLNPDGRWTTTSTILASPSVSPDANGADPLTWTEWQVSVFSPAPTRGKLRIELMGTGEAGAGTGYNTLFDSVLVTAIDPDADDGSGNPARQSSTSWKTVLRADDGSGGPALGELVKVDSPHLVHGSWVLEGDTPDPGALVLEDHQFSYLDASRYPLGRFTYDGAEFHDPAEMIFQLLRDFAGGFLYQLEGTIPLVVPPEITLLDSDGRYYVMLRGSCDLIAEQTEGTWVENKVAAP